MLNLSSTGNKFNRRVLDGQALLDIRFPDVSQHGQGLHLMSYDNPRHPWRKLTLWHAIKPCKFLLHSFVSSK